MTRCTLLILITYPPEEVRYTSDHEISIYDDNITGEDDGGVEILTRIVTVFSKTVKNRLMSAGLNVTMKHLWPHLNIPKVSDMLTMQITDHFTMLISSPPNTLLSTQTFRFKAQTICRLRA